MPRIELDLTEEEMDMLSDAVEDVHTDYGMGAQCDEDREDYAKGGPIAASLFDKVILAIRNAK
jgi:hypothetical protein